jgi:hypothetical protein
MGVFVRFLVVVLFLSSAVSVSARGRARGYRAGGGAHHTLPKLRAKHPKDKQKNPAPPPETKPDPVTAVAR